MSLRIVPSLLDEIKRRVSLSWLIGGLVALKGHGPERTGLCPFHNEKSPSFTVSEDKGFFHCFGCGANGDAFEWLVRTRNLTFPEAVQELADQAGVEIPRDQAGSAEHAANEARRASMLEALEAATQHYQAELAGPGGSEARAYLESRGISAETIARFRLGWARHGGGLRAALDRARFPDELLIEAGLRGRADEASRAYDFFHDRLIFPITDRRGRVVGFGGRVLGDGKPKYLNSPASDLFDKSTLLYGLALAQEASAKSRRVIFLEGYFDVIVAHQAGFADAVAPLGTALTEAHLDLGWKMSPEPIVCLDGDAAGRRAMERTADRAIAMLETGRRLKFATLPDGLDPDELIRTRGKAALDERLRIAKHLSEVIWDMAMERVPDANSPEYVAMIYAELYRQGSKIPDALLRTRILGDWRQWLREHWTYDEPVGIGRSKKATAPAQGSDRLQVDWEQAMDKAQSGRVIEWLSRHGIKWDDMVEQLGGIGHAHVRMLKGSVRSYVAWPDAPAPRIWDSGGDTSVLILPEWEGEVGGRILDLIAWNMRDGTLASRTGRAIVLGEMAICEARGFEARGLAHPVKIAADPLSWLRKRAAGVPAVLVVDWARVWDALGGCPSLVADNIEAGEKLERLVQPPRLRRPKIWVLQ